MHSSSVNIRRAVSVGLWIVCLCGATALGGQASERKDAQAKEAPAQPVAPEGESGDRESESPVEPTRATQTAPQPDRAARPDPAPATASEPGAADFADESFFEPEASGPQGDEDPFPLDQTGLFILNMSTQYLRPDYPGNEELLKREGSYKGEYRPDFVLFPDGPVNGVFKPRVSAGLRTSTRKTHGTDDEAVGEVGLYEAYWNWTVLPAASLQFGFVDLADGPGQLFNPGNPWYIENNSGNPNAENESEVALRQRFVFTDWFSLALLVDSNFENESFRLVTPDEPDDPESDFEADDRTYKQKVRDHINERYDPGRYYGPGRIFYDGKRYDAEDRVAVKNGSERPIYAGAQARLNYAGVELTLAGKGAQHLPPRWGSTATLTVSEGLLLYTEGSYTRGRSGRVPVETGDGRSILRLTSLRLDDYGPQYRLLLDRTDKKYSLLYDNFSGVTEALGGVQYTLPWWPITVNLEYAYDGNGYTPGERETFYRGLRWAAGPGQDELEDEASNQFYAYDVAGKQTKKFLYRDLYLRDTESADYLEQSREDRDLPPRLGQHYALLQFQYLGQGGKDQVIFRHVTNLDDNSHREVLFVEKQLAPAWTVFGNLVFDIGLGDAEFNRAHAKTISLGSRYYW